LQQRLNFMIIRSKVIILIHNHLLYVITKY